MTWDSEVFSEGSRFMVWDSGVFTGGPGIMIWDSEVFIGDPRIMIWDSDVFIGGPRTMIWDSSVFTGGTRIMVWDREVSIKGSRVMIWDSGVFTGGIRIMLWDSEGFTGGLRIMLWDCEAITEVQGLWYVSVRCSLEVLVLWFMEEDELSTWEGKCIEGQLSGDLLPRWYIDLVWLTVRGYRETWKVRARIEVRDHEEEDVLEVYSKWYFYWEITGWKRDTEVIRGLKLWKAAFMIVESVYNIKDIGIIGKSQVVWYILFFVRVHHKFFTLFQSFWNTALSWPRSDLTGNPRLLF